MASSIETDRKKRILFPAALALAWLSLADIARADPSATEKAAAQTLFDEARTLFSQGRTSEACDKWASSYKLDPRLGTLLNLAICHEKQGKLATAWTEYNDAATQARREQRAEREKYAKQHVDELAPKLPRIKLQVADAARVPGLVVTLDGANVSEAAWGTSIPVDAGEHALHASAPDREPWDQKVRLDGPGETPVQVPPLAAKAGAEKPAVARPPPPPRETQSPEPAPSESSGGRTAGFILGGVGIAVIGVGAVFGVITLNKRSDAEELCRTSNCVGAQEMNDSAKTTAWVSNGAIVAGAIALGVGAVLVFTSGSGSTHVRASATPGGAMLSGSF